MLQKTKEGLADILGMVASALCIIHCLALPIILVAGIQFAEELFETIIIAFAMVFGVVAAVSSYKKHKKPFPGLTILLGLYVILIGHTELFHHNETLFSVAGGALLLIGHYLNLKASRAVSYSK